MRSNYTAARLLPAVTIIAALQCASLAKKIFDQPQIAVDRVELKSIALTGAELIVHVKINNPNSVSATLNRLEYALDIEGERLVRGNKDDKTVIAANNLSIISLPLTVNYAGLSAGISSALTKKFLLFNFTGKVVLDTPIGDLSFNLAEKGEIPIPDRPRFELIKVALAEFTVVSATLMLHVKTTNNHDFELDIRSFRYEFTLQDSLISASEIAVERVVGHDKSITIAIPITIKLLNLKRGIVDMLKSGRLQYALKLNLDLNTKFGPVTLPYEKEGLTSLY